ncbi:MAG: AAA family ATPase [Gammaproteobacteria bacterium]|nr:AAA family ATPase [Gammaproteobacteria bacterium]NNL52298.1 AAA family ATPase [Woeseiaceae bacterium]
MNGFRKALATQDAVVVVSGPVGTGKTTLVHRALEGTGSKYKTIRVGRMKMDANDVLESLLVVLGVKDRPAGTIQRFSALRKKLRELQEAEVKVFIVVEEALRTGTDTLAELEALTAADAGDSDGASIILMGDERITEFMKEPQLGQLQQRVRQRHRIAPLCAAEMRGYLMHGFRQAGGDFEQLFDDRSSDLLQQLSGGIPRIANNLIDSVLTAAAAQQMNSITASFVATIANEEFGLEADDFDFSTPESEQPPEEQLDEQPEEKPDDKDTPEAQDDIPHLIQDTLPDLAILAPKFAALDTEAEPQATEPEQPEAVQVSQDTSDAVADIEAEPVELCIPELTPEPLVDPAPELVAEEDSVAEDIPELIAEEQAVVEDIPELVAEEQPVVEDIPELVAEEQPVVEDIPELVAEEQPVVEDIPELVAEEQPVAEDIPELVAEEQPVAEDIPELVAEEEPLAEDVLSMALEPDADFAQLEVAAESDQQPVSAEPKPDLDALEQAMAFAHGASEEGNDLPEITLDKSIETGVGNPFADEPEDAQSPEPAEMPGADLGAIAAEIGNAKTLDDIDDKMAETLFGTGLGMIAAQMIANPPAGTPANDDQQPKPAKSVAPTPLQEISLEAPLPTATSRIDLTASQRLKMARALNTDLRNTPGNAGASHANGNGVTEAPKPIEDQIDTSLTNTLKALKVPSPPVDDEPEERTKTGFFSRFRRS